MSYWYNWFSWWWAHGCSKHVEHRNKHKQKITVRQVGYLQELYRDAESTGHKIYECLFGYCLIIAHENLDYSSCYNTKSCSYQPLTVTPYPLLCCICTNVRFYNTNYACISLRGMTYVEMLNMSNWFYIYRVIHKSLRDFRTRLRNNQDRHGRKEHINR